MTSNHPSRAFYLFIIVLGLYAIFPLPAARWAGQVVATLIVPISDPMSRIQRLVRSETQPFEEESPEVRALLTQLEEAGSRIANLESRIGSLVRQIQVFESMYRLDDSYRYVRANRVMSAGVQGGSSFQINAGTQRGAETGTVVVIPELFQLVGRVSRADRMTSIVTPITDENADPIRGEIVPDGGSMERSDVNVQVSLEATGSGTLEGKIDRGAVVKVGDAVRLRDSAWGESHTGLLIGMVTELKPFDPQPLHQIIVVEPTADLSRMAEVMLKVRRTSTESGRNGGDR